MYISIHKKGVEIAFSVLILCQSQRLAALLPSLISIFGVKY